AAWAERALSLERAFADSLVDIAQVIILVLDARGRILRTNPYLRTVTGHRDADLLGHEWGLLLPPGDRPAAWGLVWQAVNFGAAGSFSGGLVTRGGQRAVAWSAKALPHSAAVGPAVLVLGHDITELQGAQRQALQAERLAAIGQVMAALAHESRNL